MRPAKPDDRRRLGTQVTRPGPEVLAGGHTWQPSESFPSDTCKSLLNPVTWCHMYALGTKGETWPLQSQEQDGGAANRQGHDSQVHLQGRLRL